MKLTPFVAALCVVAAACSNNDTATRPAVGSAAVSAPGIEALPGSSETVVTDPSASIRRPGD